MPTYNRSDKDWKTQLILIKSKTNKLDVLPATLRTVLSAASSWRMQRGCSLCHCSRALRSISMLLLLMMTTMMTNKQVYFLYKNKLLFATEEMTLLSILLVSQYHCFLWFLNYFIESCSVWNLIIWFKRGLSLKMSICDKVFWLSRVVYV